MPGPLSPPSPRSGKRKRELYRSHARLKKLVIDGAIHMKQIGRFNCVEELSLMYVPLPKFFRRQFSPRIESIKTRVEDALSRQRRFLQSIATGELQAQKERLDVYTIQARFALAAIYDIAASAGEESE